MRKIRDLKKSISRLIAKGFFFFFFWKSLTVWLFPVQCGTYIRAKRVEDELAFIGCCRVVENVAEDGIHRGVKVYLMDVGMGSTR